jgi:electron transfer flavoprotein alpha subunit
MTQETRIPANHVVGVVKGHAAVEQTIEALRGAGFHEVLVMEHVDATGEGANPLAALIEKLAGQLSEETGIIDQYKEQTEAGGIVLAVRVESKGEAERVSETMDIFGAVNIRLFGRLAVSDLTPGTNPSAPSDERPTAPSKRTEAS